MGGRGQTSPSDVVHRNVWPTRLWAPARIRYRTRLSPDEVVSRLLAAGEDYSAPRSGNLSKIGYRIELTHRGFKLFKVAGGFLGNPPRVIALFDATTLKTEVGTVVDGEVRLPYSSLATFGFLLLAVIGIGLSPLKGAVIPALVLWGGFGSLFLLAQRADAGASVPTFVDHLDSALGHPLAISANHSELPIQPNPTAEHPARPIFQSRGQAAVYLAGLTIFWSGFFVEALMRRQQGQSPPSGQLGLVEAAVLVCALIGGLLLTRTYVSMTERTLPLNAVVRMITPDTIFAAARRLSLNGPVVAGALYAVLVGGIVAFLRGLPVP